MEFAAFETVGTMKRPSESPESTAAIGKRLEALRKAHNMNQAVWCRLVGIGPPAWNNYEKGLRRISLDQALKICKATGVGLNYIFRGLTSDVPVSIAIALQKPPTDKR